MGIRPVVLVTALLMAAFGLATGVVAAQELSPRTGYTPGCAERSDDAERECRVDLGRSISPFGVGSAAASVLMIAGVWLVATL